jgi:hypothetical protein
MRTVAQRAQVRTRTSRAGNEDDVSWQKPKRQNRVNDLRQSDAGTGLPTFNNRWKRAKVSGNVANRTEEYANVLALGTSGRRRGGGMLACASTLKFSWFTIGVRDRLTNASNITAGF